MLVRRFIYLGYGVPLLVLAAGCSTTPGEADARAVVEARIRDQAEGRIRLAAFDKTNAQTGESFGVQLYTIEYSAQIEFTEDSYWKAGTALQRLYDDEPSFYTKSAAQTPGFWGKWIMDQEGYVKVRKGERRTLAGTLVFEETEKGWRISSG